jgi:hypothetical protein
MLEKYKCASFLSFSFPFIINQTKQQSEKNTTEINIKAMAINRVGHWVCRRCGKANFYYWESDYCRWCQWHRYLDPY